jgi:hypothetical protein
VGTKEPQPDKGCHADSAFQPRRTRDGSGDMAIPLELLAGEDQDVPGEPTATQCTVHGDLQGSPAALDRTHDEQVHIVLCVRRAPGMRAKQDDTLRVKAVHQGGTAAGGNGDGKRIGVRRVV